ncbi:MAG TPA: hypothetical protein VFS75_02420 [Candidatus Paceibacterota bacterium]|nr:hypothetical protein [Candidatus Paceibacterota bacterium]
MIRVIFMRRALAFAALLATLFAPVVALAQTSQMMSVTPPLFQLSAKPGDVWQSSIKVVNGNAYPLTVYAEVVDFRAVGEEGQGTFVPLTDDADGSTLASWIDIPEGPHVIEPEKTKDIPFVVDIPKDAPPGGHYAAILTTTKPPAKAAGESAVFTSQAVTSLFFVRIEGDVREAGDIREFSVENAVVPKPEATFSVRFENKGNVHLQPRGDIVITNMWGTERGVIPINNDTQFGNVLPESIRNFTFTWQRDLSFTDVGRYRALVTLAYGENGVKSVSSITYFWVIPVKITLITLTILAFFIALIVWMVKVYVRRMLALAGIPVSGDVSRAGNASRDGSVHVPSYRKVSAPIRSGVLDLRTRLSSAPETKSTTSTLISFVVEYKAFFVSLLILILIGVTAVLYIGRARTTDDDYRVIIKQGDETRTIEGKDVEGGAR